MERDMVVTLLVSLALLCPDAFCGDPDTLTIIHVNDTHSHLTAGGPRNAALEGTLGGIARAATLVRKIEATSPNPWFLHAGDLSVGDMFYNVYFGVPEYRILKSLGCKAMAVGNHEWDLGPAALDSALSTAFGAEEGFPLLSANTVLDDPRVQGLRKYIRAFITGSAGGRKIGVFGLTTPETNLFSSPAPAFVDTPFKYAAAIVDTLRAQGCSAIICLSHLGLALDRQVASTVPGINVIVGGHDHYELGTPVGIPSGEDTTWIVQSGARYEHVGVLQVLIGVGHVRLLASRLMPVDSSVAGDREIEGTVASLVQGVESKYGPVFSKQIATSTGFFSEVAESLMQRTHGETPAGMLVTDAFRDLTGTDVAIEPGGSTAEPLYPGPVVADDCFRVIGYGFNDGDGLGYPLVRFDMTGKALIQGIEMGLSDIESNDEYFIQSSGLRYTYDPSRRAGERFVSATVGGKPLRPARKYSVTANYFVKLFLDRLGVPYTQYRAYGPDTTEFMALTRYVSKRRTLAPAAVSRGPGNLPFTNTRLTRATRVNDLVSRMTLKEKIGQMQNHAPAIPRLGVPEYDWWSEALHGVARNGIATVFPQAIGMAATWNPSLIHAEADVVSTEARAKHNESVRRNQRGIYQGLTFWSPNINIFRDPRWGRGQETYGEDPFLTSRIGVAFVRGLQGDDPKYFRVIATPKHFAVHSGPEQLRHGFDARATGRDLYETYLPAFEACVIEGGAYSVMGAYNRFRGEPCTASALLLGKNLRERWKFPGYVVSDCGAITDIYAGHHFASDAAGASALAVKAGCDLTCGNEYSSLEEAVSRGLISENEIDTAVRRLMTARFRLGMFDPPDSVPYARIPFTANDTPDHRALALDVARESIVLLRNSGNALPLRRDIRSIAVIGPTADDQDVLIGNYNGTPSHPVTLLQGIRDRAGKGTNVRYAKGCELADGMSPKDSLLPAEAIALARESDQIIAVMGISPLLEGEEMSVNMNGFRGGDRTDITLPAPQRKLLESLVSIGKPIVLVLTNGSALAVPWEDEHIGGILEAWYPGEEGGDAVADVLFGNYNPAGRLPVTFYRSVDDIPPFENYSMEGRTYRYFRGKPLYPFGYGLSYTRFEYTGVSARKTSVRSTDSVNVGVTLVNRGEREGDEVVQMYVTGPDTDSGSPIRSLKSFARVHLKKGEEKSVTLTLRARDLRVYDESLDRYVVRPGAYTLGIGGSSADLPLHTEVRVTR